MIVLEVPFPLGRLQKVDEYAGILITSHIVAVSSQIVFAISKDALAVSPNTRVKV